MSRNLVKLFVAFLAGQIFTIFLVFVGRVLYVDSILWFCIITSVMVDAIIGFVGFFAANEGRKPTWNTPRGERQSNKRGGGANPSAFCSKKRLTIMDKHRMLW